VSIQEPCLPKHNSTFNIHHSPFNIPPLSKATIASRVKTFAHLTALFATLLAGSLFAQTTQTTIVVTAHPSGPLGETAEDVNIVGREELQTAVSPAMDDVLRGVPGFALFRRTGSREANPTSQGVSLRGIGASGASRALVLDDGIPLNDPFGGWIYWGRIPLAAIERVEILRGGASDLYGSAAMGGVVDCIRRDRGLLGEDMQFVSSAGSEATRAASFFAGAVRGAWSGSVAADLFDTNGYVLVVPAQRGAVDVQATSRHTALDGTLRRGGAFVRASSYAESRGNGTPLTVNDTHLQQVAAGVDALGSVPLAIRGYLVEQRYHQTFSSVASDRSTERLTVDQRVPTRATGGSVDWRPLFGALAAVIGTDWSDVKGTSHEQNVALSGAVTPFRAGGHQRTAAGRAMLLWHSERLTITGGARFDRWQNFDAEQNGSPLPSRRDTAWSPRATALYEVAPRVSLTASAYSSFRAPTLNELYRGFRVGNVVTQPNAVLGPERLTGSEVGARLAAFRVTLFDMRIADTIANVTLSSTPSLITRQRQNFGSSRSRGAELEWSRNLGAMRLTAGYLLAAATLSTGKQSPQVPRQAATLQLGRNTAAGTFGVQTRWSSRQFDDDLNQFPLASSFVTDLFVSRPVAPHVDLQLALENIFNARVEASATPVFTIGQPRAARVAVRYSLGR
jgi:outer membrane receptor protein involved in Fe transport